MVVGTAAGAVAVLVGRRLPRTATATGDVVATLHLVGGGAGLLAWVAFLVLVGRIGETPASVVGIVGLAGWWLAAATGLTLLARRPSPLWLAVLTYVGLLVAVGFLSWAYATHLV